MTISLYSKNNALLEEGKLDEQIIVDLEEYIQEQRRYQTEYLDVHVKTGAPHHYEQWTKKTQDMIRYAERILECVKTQIK